MDRTLIEFKKEYSRLKKNGILAANGVKGTKCVICGKQAEGFCVSHSVPQFVLKRIAINGNVLRFRNFAEKSVFEKNIIGIHEAGIFKNICHKCDSEFFKAYEDGGKLLSKPVQQDTLKAIAVKSLLCSSDTYLNDGTTLDIIRGKLDSDDQLINEFLSISSKLNMEEDKRDLKELIAENGDSVYFNVDYHEILNYTVPMACQIASCLQFDLEGNCMGNNFSQEKNEILYIAVLPEYDKTFVVMFMDNRNTRYENFISQFRRLDERRKLAVINYIIFLTSDKIFLSPSLEKLRKNKNFKLVCRFCGPELLGNLKDSYMNLAHMVNIPNILTMKMKK